MPCLEPQRAGKCFGAHGEPQARQALLSRYRRPAPTNNPAFLWAQNQLAKFPALTHGMPPIRARAAMAAASWKFWLDSSKMTLVRANFRLPNRGRPRTEPPPCRAGPAAARADEPVIAKKTGPTKPINRGKSHDAEFFARGRLRGVFVRRDERGRPAEGRLDRRQGRSRAAPRREKAPRVV